MRQIVLVGVAAAGVMVALACSGDSAGLRPSIAVSISVQPEPAVPGDTLRVAVTAVPSGGAVVDVIRLTAAGLVTATDSMHFSGDGPQSHIWTYALPYQPSSGDVAFTAAAQGGGVSAIDKDTALVADLLPPELTALDATPIVLVPTDTVTVTYSARDNAGVWWTVVRISGAFTATDSVDHAFAKQVSRSVRIPVPASVTMGSTFTVKVIAADPALHRDSAVTAPIQVNDLGLPSVSGVASGPEPVLTFVANDTLRLAVNASDNYKLAWVGYRIGAPASLSDSIAVAGRNASQNFTLIPTSAWIGTQTVTAFTRDSAGYLVQTSLGNATVVGGVRRPTFVFPLQGAIPDLVYDSARNVVYFSEPSLNRVRVFSLATRTFAAPINLFARPFGLDLTPGGDSLVVSLGQSTSLAIVNLQNRQVDTANLPLNPNVSPSLAYVRVMANRKAFVATAVGGGVVWELDLGTLSRRVRTDAAVTEIVPMARAGDGSRLLMIGDNSCCPETGSLYLSATDTFAISAPTADRYTPRVSADRSGSHFLVDTLLFDGTLNSLRTLSSSPFAFGGSSALSADGLAAYLAIDSGYLKVRTGDGVVVDTVRTGQTFYRFIAVSSGAWLVGVSGNPQLAQQLVVVDLH
ncbi:MAG TPA: hypothetical protein VGJ80_13675 [Gemmatimonadales bacterium]